MAANITDAVEIPTKSKDIIALLIPAGDQTKGYLDLTGRFPYKSGQGNQYILVVYHVEADAILVEPIKN